jgi:cobalt-zinc-cadmium efflux system protein
MHDHAHHGHGDRHRDYGSSSGIADRDQNQAANRRRLTIVLFLAAGFSVTEITGGVLTGSLALMADAFHLVSDVAALGLSLFAAWMSQRPASARRTYGHSRAEILAALANGVGLAVIAIVIMIGAIERFGNPAEINGLGVVAFACVALLYEGISLWLLNAGRAHNLNVQGAWLHILSDAFGSLGAIASGLAIWAYGWYWADSAASLLISGLVLHSAWRLIRDAVDVLMETAPAHLEVDQIRAGLADLPSVGSVHDLHVWTIGSGEVSLSCHLVTESRSEIDVQKLLNLAKDLLRDRFEILHTTVQVERPSPGAADGVVAGLDCEGACEAAE